MIEETDPECLMLFLLLGLLPGGIRNDELDEIWVLISKIKKMSEKRPDLRRIMSNASFESNDSKFAKEDFRGSPWEEAKMKL